MDSIFFWTDKRKECLQNYAWADVQAKILSHMKRYNDARTHGQWQGRKGDSCPYPVRAKACVKITVGDRGAITEKLRERQHKAWERIKTAVPQKTQAQWARAKLALDTVLTMGYPDESENDPQMRRSRQLVRNLPATQMLAESIARISKMHHGAPHIRIAAFETISEAGLVSERNMRGSARLLATLAGDDPNVHAGHYYNRALLPQCESVAEQHRRVIADEMTVRAIARESEATREQLEETIGPLPYPDPDTEQSTLVWQARAHDARTGQSMERTVRTALENANWQPTPLEHPSCAAVMRAPWDYAERPSGSRETGATTLDLGLNAVEYAR